MTGLMRLDILVVDDDSAAADAVALTLRDAGRNVVIATTREQAVAICLAFAFDLIISDVQMPGVADAAMIMHLRLVCPRTPIVALSGGDPLETRRLAIANGAQAFVAKPCRAGVLLEAIQAVTSPADAAA